MNTPLRIVKVGGSLFNLPNLSQRLQTWLATQPAGMTVLLAGCGEFGNVVRKFDTRFHLGEERCHFMCIDLLGVTSQLLAGLLPTAIVTEDHLAIAERSLTNALIVFKPDRFLRKIEPKLTGDALPVGWDVTTDSIAARLAEVTHADDLVLLKSAPPPKFELLDELADMQYVDRYFPWAVKSLAEVRFVNLTDDHFPQVYAFE